MTAEGSTELLYIGSITLPTMYRQDLFESSSVFVKRVTIV